MTTIEEIKAQLDAITPEPWEAQIDPDGELIIVTPFDADANAIIWCGNMETSTARDHCNHEFIAAAPASMRWCIDEIARLRALCTAALEGLDEYWVTLPENAATVQALEVVAGRKYT